MTLPAYDEGELFSDVEAEGDVKNGLFFVRKVKEAYRREGYVDAQVVGPKSTGKTAYADYCLYQTYGSWKLAAQFMFMRPRAALQMFREAHRKRIRLPLVVIDDAGKHLNRSQWWREDIVKFAEFYNLIRSVTSGCLFTEPSFKIPESIAKDIKYTIMTETVSQRRLIPLLKEDSDKSRIWQARVHRAKELGVNPLLWCHATIYKRWARPDGMVLISPNKSHDYYPLHYPNKKDIDEMRRQEVEAALEEALAEEGAKTDKMGLRIYLAYEAMRQDGYKDKDIAERLGYRKTSDLMYHVNQHRDKTPKTD